jgi:hypothetical protein
MPVKLPIYESDQRAVKCEIKTFCEFPKNLFAGSELRKAALKFTIQQRIQSALIRATER